MKLKDRPWAKVKQIRVAYESLIDVLYRTRIRRGHQVHGDTKDKRVLNFMCFDNALP